MTVFLKNNTQKKCTKYKNSKINGRAYDQHLSSRKVSQ